VIKRFVPLLVAFSFLVVGVVHACSGLSRMQIVSLHNASDDAGMAGQPCDQKKRDDDVCKGVRYRMLSLKAEWTQNDLTLPASPLPVALSVEDSITFGSVLAVPARTAAFEFPSKNSPRLSPTVLRI
jgi:hypothetical protein